MFSLSVFMHAISILKMLLCLFIKNPNTLEDFGQFDFLHTWEWEPSLGMNVNSMMSRGTLHKLPTLRVDVINYVDV